MKQNGGIDKTFIDQVAHSLASNRIVRRKLPGRGRIHIDRQQPFLCVYRYPADRQDAGTADLILSQASYILVDPSDQSAAGVTELIDRLATVLADAFGGLLFLEIWSGPETEASLSGAPQSPRSRFRIVAPKRNSPQRTLDSLEKALISSQWPAGEPEVSVSYGSRMAPPGMKPLITARRAQAIGCTRLGLEIAPVYRSADTGTPYPQVLRRMTRPLGHVLKQTFFTFAHTRARYRPAHYHELGRRAMTRAVWEVDRQLAEIADSFDLLLHLTPVNAEPAWSGFRGSHFGRPPEFLYRPQEVDASTLKRRLFRIPLERIEDAALHQLFEEKRDELDRQISMLADRGTENLLYGSLQVFGAASDRLVNLAKKLLAKIPPHAHDDKAGEFLDAKTFVDCATREIEHLRRQSPTLAATVQLRDDVPGLMVSRGHLLVGRGTRVPRARLQATLQHEVGTHVLTYHNGRAQPFHQLHSGVAGYEELQEGLAVLAEYLVGGLSRPRLRLLAARVLAVDSLRRGAEFIETFRLLHDEYGYAQHGAYMIAMRVYRGGGLTKDAVYLRGLVNLLDYLADGHDLEPLLIGKVALDQVELIEELRWRQVLNPPALRPKYLDDPSAKKRLAALAQGIDVLDMAQKVLG